MTEREDIDDSLQEEAMRIGCLKTREETVNQAQREFIERLEAEKLIAAFGTVDFDEGYDYKTERKRRARDQPDGSSGRGTPQAPDFLKKSSRQSGTWQRRPDLPESAAVFMLAYSPDSDVVCTEKFLHV